jgi:hypothetical protein
VYVTAAGQLGVQGSSERFKTDIAPMPELAGKLAQLRLSLAVPSAPISMLEFS